MTFRDAAQGAYRMRQIGRGQTITILSPPTALGLVREASALGASQSEAERAAEAAALPPSLAAQRRLRDVAAWLHTNSMHSEALQFNLLCEQSVRNVFRKQAESSIKYKV